MDPITAIIVFGVVIVFGAVLFISIQSKRRDTAAKQLLQTQLGFVAADPTPAVAEKIADLYKRDERDKALIFLHNVSRKPISAGEMYLFDLRRRSTESNAWREMQAVAIIKPELRLPHLAIFPKIGQDQWVAGLANTILTMAVANTGQEVMLDQYPELQQRFLINSREPEQAQAFLSSMLAGRLAQAESCSIRMYGDTFIFSEIDPQPQTPDVHGVSRRIERATEILEWFSPSREQAERPTRS
jgi:hypothetical protein